MTDKQEREIRSKLLLERHDLVRRIALAEREYFDAADGLYSVSQHMVKNPRMFTAEDEAFLQNAPALVPVIHDYLEMHKRLDDLNRALGGE
ncbi:MAG TPA: hypothetical protein VKQ28_05200 [Candidatus Acidoferrum sp.]|nr:hypothetical protein [Candidatus Acidoferrum sp.]